MQRFLKKIILKLQSNIVLSFIVHTAILIMVVLLVLEYIQLKKVSDEYSTKFKYQYEHLDYKIDSLHQVYNDIQNSIAIRQATHDSLIRIKSEIIKDYEKNTKNLYNKLVVSDDSVTLYISKKIYNR